MVTLSDHYGFLQLTLFEEGFMSVSFWLSGALLVGFLTVSGCASEPDKKEAAIESSMESTTSYFYGNTAIKSGDGKTLRGTSVSLVKRVVDPAANLITETVVQPPRDPKTPPREIVATLKRRPGTNIFDATDSENTFKGKVTYSGDVWKWNAWTYDIDLKDGNRVQGKGTLDGAGIHTKKSLSNKMEIVTVQIMEDLMTIDEATYNQRRSEILKK
jgi:hypothetical protein